MSKGVTFPHSDGSQLKIGIVQARWNRELTDSLFDGCKKAIRESGVKEENIVHLEVPGSYETVFGAKHLIQTAQVDAVVCLGVLVKGETMHFEYIAEAVTHGIMRLNLETKVPVIFGILTCLSEDQARARSFGENNHGIGWGKTAVEMALLKKKN
jgi:6,7-dimethyl-8-ribityllumazine synthase